MIEPSSSIVVRSEHQFNQHQTDRMALRLHMYELVHDALTYTREFRAGADTTLPSEGGPQHQGYLERTKRIRDRLVQGLERPLGKRKSVAAADAPLHGLIGGQPVCAEDRFGQYLGFLDIRPWYNADGGGPLALGLLAPPRRYMLDPRAYVITGDYSPIFGGPPFASTVYCQHDEKTSGAHCAQAALVMALGMLSDRGARIEGSYGITYRAWRYGIPRGREARDTHPDFPAPGAPESCLVHRVRERETKGEGLRRAGHHCLGIAGLVPDQSWAVLRGNDQTGTGELRASSNLVKLKEPRGGAAGSFEDQLARRLIEAYVSARFPVILYVDAGLWWKPLEKRYPSSGHAVTVIGYRQWGRRHGENGGEASHAFITHDPGHVPFFEQPDDTCMDAAWGFDAAKRQAAGLPRMLQFLGLADRLLVIHPRKCIEYLLGRNNVHVGPDNRPSFEPHGGDQERQVGRFRQYRTSRTHRRFRIRLAHSDDFIRMFGDELPSRAARDRFGRFPQDLNRAPGRYWCVLGYRAGRLQHLWAFAADRPLSDATWPAPHPYWFDAGRGWRVPRERARGQRADEAPARAPTTVPEIRPGAPRLKPSVITSCSPRNLRYLTSELTGVDNLSRFDLFVFRETDLMTFRQWVRGRSARAPRALVERLEREAPNSFVQTEAQPSWTFASTANLLGGANDRTTADRDQLRELIVKWLVEEVNIRPALAPSLMFAAFATYFPDITAADEVRRELARRALAETVLMGLALRENSPALFPQEIGLVVEMVCGTVVDRCECKSCAQIGRCFVSTDRSKIELLVRELGFVAEAVLQTAVRKEWNDWRFALALELEPGDTYVLNNSEQLRSLFREIQRPREEAPPIRPITVSGSQPSEPRWRHEVTYEVPGESGSVCVSEPLSKYVGLNLDIAHMLSASVSAEALVPFRDAIVHAHISDLPGIHSRDQVPASFTFPRYCSGESADERATYAPYIALLRGCVNLPRMHWPGYSGTCALELEGCGRIDWVHRGVSWMKRLYGLD